MNVYHFLADAVLVVHATYVGIVVFGLVAILLGIVLRWRWVRNFYFRAVHFLMIALVAGESFIGFECPLTTLEDSLRTEAGQKVAPTSFVGRWCDALLFHRETPEWVFTVAYSLFAAAVLAVFILAPPERPRWWRWPRRTTRPPNET